MSGSVLWANPFIGTAVLREKGYPEEVIEAILGHATYSGVPRTTLMAKTLFAVDELAGFITAVAYVRESGAFASRSTRLRHAGQAPWLRRGRSASRMDRYSASGVAPVNGGRSVRHAYRQAPSPQTSVRACALPLTCSGARKRGVPTMPSSSVVGGMTMMRRTTNLRRVINPWKRN